MNHKEYIHAWIHEFTDLGLVFDMTCGNGHDTLFLAQVSTSVIAVDIQEQAILETKKRTSDYQNIQYIPGSHDDIDLSHLHQIDGAIYNLGYLPGSDKSIITQTQSTLKSLINTCPHLRRFLVVSCYRSHDGGMDEYLAVKSFLESLDAELEVFDYQKETAPVTFLVKFNK